MIIIRRVWSLSIILIDTYLSNIILLYVHNNKHLEQVRQLRLVATCYDVYLPTYNNDVIVHILILLNPVVLY